MRISTSMVYNLGGKAVQSQMSDLYKLQGQLSSGKRITTPSDDPLASARVLEVHQSQSTTEQLSTNADYASSALEAQEAALGRVSDLLGEVRALGVYAGNSSLSLTDRQALAASLKAKYTELIGLANTQDNGKYLFSGYQGETQPFSEISPGIVAYNGDEGARLIQVTPSRQVPVSSAGVDVFQRVRNGNGELFVSADPAITGVTNTGTGVATPTELLDPTLWNATGNTKDYSVVFAQDTTVQPPVVTYDIVANVATTVNAVAYAAGDSLLTGAPSLATASTGGGPRYPRAYTEGTAISFKFVAGDTNPDTAWDLGIEFSVKGTPTSTPTDSIPVTLSDTFTVKDSVADQDIFNTIYKLVDLLEGGSPTQIGNGVMTLLEDLTQAEETVMSALTTVGVTLQEVDSHKGTNEDLILQYKTTISDLSDLDYASAITDLTLRQANLTASQKSFLAVQNLSLFNFI